MKTLPPWVFQVAAEFRDYEKGIHPVSTGRAPWLTGLYQETLRAMRDVISEEQAAANERAAAKAKK